MAYRRFVAPREIAHGWGALRALKYVAVAKAFVVTDRLMVKLGHLDKVAAILKEGGVLWEFFDDVEPDPSLEMVKRCFARVTGFAPDLIIALGGGSVIDTAKTAWAFYENPDLAEMGWEEMRQALPRRALRRKARLVGIPTTSGTGSEVSFGAVITNREIDPPEKRILFSFQLAPDVAIVDAQLAATMPRDVTAATGYDALVHAVEAYVSSEPGDMVDAMAVRAVRTILEWLPLAVADGSNVTAREKMHLAATMAMAAGTNGAGSLNHDLAHQLGAFYRIVHGRANAVMLPYTLAWMYPTCSAREAGLARELGMTVKDTLDGAQRLIAVLSDLRDRVGLPGSLKTMGIPEGVFMTRLDSIAEYTVASNLSPQKATREEVREIYLRAWRGEEARIG